MISQLSSEPHYFIILDEDKNKIIHRELRNSTVLLKLENEEIANCDICFRKINLGEICLVNHELKKFNCINFNCVFKSKGSKNILYEIPLDIIERKGISIGETYMPLTYKKYSNKNWWEVKLT